TDADGNRRLAVTAEYDALSYAYVLAEGGAEYRLADYPNKNYDVHEDAVIRNFDEDGEDLVDLGPGLAGRYDYVAVWVFSGADGTGRRSERRREYTHHV